MERNFEVSPGCKLFCWGILLKFVERNCVPARKAASCEAEPKIQRFSAPNRATTERQPYFQGNTQHRRNEGMAPEIGSHGTFFFYRQAPQLLIVLNRMLKLTASTSYTSRGQRGKAALAHSLRAFYECTGNGTGSLERLDSTLRHI